MYSFPNLEPVPCPVLTVASWPAYRFLKKQVRWSGIPISIRVFHSLLWRLKVGREGEDRAWDGWMAPLSWWTLVWVNCGSWWWTERPGVLQSMGSQRVGHDWATELNWPTWMTFSGACEPCEQVPQSLIWGVLRRIDVNLSYSHIFCPSSIQHLLQCLSHSRPSMFMFLN